MRIAGVLPIENTTAGSVYEAYDLLLRYNLSLVGEEIVDVRHCLLGVADVPLESLRRIHSHPQALAQCSEWLGTLPGCEAIAAANTALAAQHVSELRDPTQAAIASAEAGVALRPAGPAARYREPARELHPVRRGGRGARGVRPADRGARLDGPGHAPRAWRARRAA